MSSPSNDPASAGVELDDHADMVSTKEKTGDPDVVKKGELIDRIVTRTGLKKRDVKPAVEAAFAEMIDVLLLGKSLKLPPVGKIKMMNAKDLDNGAQVLTIKIRTAKPSTPVDDLDDDAAPVAAE